MQAFSEKFLAGKDRYALAALRRSNKAQVVSPERMAAVRVPVLGIVGSKDPYRASFEELKKIMPRLNVVVLDGATHITATTHPGFVPAILDFLRRSAAPAC
jgi:pimeloyl-ACP methyl ester carboxylesterase